MATTSEFVRSCKPLNLPNRVDPSNLLCKAEHPVFPQSNNVCLFKLFNNPYNNPTNCNTRKIFYQQQITRLSTPNSWLYMSIQPLKMEIFCTKGRYPVSLQGTGILHFKDHCVANSEKFSLPTLIVDTKRINISDLFFYPNITIPDAPEFFSKQPTEPSYHPFIKTKVSNHESHNVDLINEDIKLRDLEQSVAITEDELTRNSKHHSVPDHFWPLVFITSFLTISTLSVIFLCFWKLRKCLRTETWCIERATNLPASVATAQPPPPQKVRKTTAAHLPTSPKFPKLAENTGTLPKLLPK